MGNGYGRRAPEMTQKVSRIHECKRHRAISKDGEVPGDRFGDARLLQLHDHSCAVVEDSPLHLADRCGGDGLRRDPP